MKFKIIKHKSIRRSFPNDIEINEWYTVKYKWWIFWFTLEESCYADDTSIITFDTKQQAKDYIDEYRKLKLEFIGGKK